YPFINKKTKSTKMSFILASNSTTIHNSREKTNQPTRKHLRLNYFKKINSDFDVAPAPKKPVDTLPVEPTESSLFSALLLQKAGFKNIQIFECQNRVGGRVHTQYFNKEQKLYGELGAMRIPVAEEHHLVFDTIDYLNQRITNDDKIRTIPFIFSAE
ncbi:2148_t:CDS:2, partial [Racocetra persica]